MFLKKFLRLLARPALVFAFAILVLEFFDPGIVSRWVSLPWLFFPVLTIGIAGLVIE